ncbi:MAG: hypothetical protein Q8L55_01020, partial [Phycisphaerales bacterium]|nr:hypothetical protein [Phycisphaerales bacterium]
IYYPIVFPKPGDKLVVDAETTGWLRVMYPPSVKAFVSADEAQESGAGKVRLVKASKLKAPNANSGVKGAFLGVQEAELPIGTEFKIFETIKDDAGKVLAYAIEPPASARGWISREAVRRATDSEAAPVLAALGAPGAAAVPAVVSPSSPSQDAAAVPERPKPDLQAPAAVPPANPTQSPEVAAPHSPAAVPTADPAPAPSIPPVPSVPPAAESQPQFAPPPSMPVVIPTSIPATAPSGTPPAGMEIPSTVPVGDKDGGGAAMPRTVQPPVLAPTRAATFDSLKDLYNSVRAQPAASAELEQAIAEFERFKGSLGSSPRDIAQARQLDAYIAAMKMRKEVRDLQNANAALNRDTELLKSEVGRRVIDLEKQRVYDVIGRLVRSTVYDGGRAPVLYRVMSPEPGSARTLGYLLPDQKFDYANKLEQVVGIIGELRPDESLRTNLIIPKRVDVVSLAPIVISPEIPGAFAPATPPRAGTPAGPAPAVPAAPAMELPSLPGGPPPAVAPPTPAPADQPEKP